MCNFNVHPCKLSDEDAYVSMNLKFISSVRDEHPYWESLNLPNEDQMRINFRQALSNPHSITMYIAELNGTPIGYSNTWCVYSIWSSGKSLIIDDLFIDELYRNKGYGKCFMDNLIAISKENGFKRIQLNAEKDNISAHRFYENLEFSNEEMLFFMKTL